MSLFPTVFSPEGNYLQVHLLLPISLKTTSHHFMSPSQATSPEVPRHTVNEAVFPSQHHLSPRLLPPSTPADTFCSSKTPFSACESFHGPISVFPWLLTRHAPSRPSVFTVQIRPHRGIAHEPLSELLLSPLSLSKSVLPSV